MKKRIWLLLVLVLLIIAGIGFFYYRSLQTSYGTIIISASPPVNPVSTAEATPSPTKLSPEEQDKLPGGMFDRTATEADYVLAGINVLKDKAKDIIAKHGQPMVKDKDDTWHYPDFDITLNNGHGIWGIKINRGEYQTTRGIKIGDSIEKLFEKYGIQTEKSTTNKGQPLTGQHWFQYSSGNGFSINFSTDNGKVTEISIYCDVD